MARWGEEKRKELKKKDKAKIDKGNFRQMKIQQTGFIPWVFRG